MLGFIGRWAASKGMVAVPNLIGLLNTAAQTAIANSGLTFGSSSTTNTGDSGLANKVASQTPTSGTLANYESSVSFVYYTYVAPPFFPFFPPFFPPYFAPVAPFFPPYFAAPYPNIGTVVAYGAGPGQAWTQTEAYITWGGSGWGSYTVVANNGSSSNQPTSAGGPPVLLTGFTAGTTYSVTVTLYSGANYTGTTATGSTNFTTAATVSPFFPPYFAPVPFFPPYFAPAITPTISNLQVDPTNTGGTVTWNSTNQASYCISAAGLSLDGSCGATATSRVASFGSPGTQYTIAVTVYSGNLYTGNTATASVTFTTTGGVVAPFFPPYFAPAPFFPPYFAPAPFFPPYFAPVAPFFPPYFVPVAPFFPPYFAPAPFFPPYFAPPAPTVVYIEYGDCISFVSCPEGGEQLVYREYSDGSTTYTYDCCLY